MRDAGNAGVLRVAEDGGAELDRPALAFQFAHADEGVLFRGGVALVVVVVKQAGGGVELDEAGRAHRRKGQGGRLRLRRRRSRRSPLRWHACEGFHSGSTR